MHALPTPSTIALIGNPNAGKTTLFNALTGANQKVGNYSGVTVELKSGEIFTPHGKKLRVLDLPGCYSLRAPSPDEKVAVDALKGELARLRQTGSRRLRAGCLESRTPPATRAASHRIADPHHPRAQHGGHGGKIRPAARSGETLRRTRRARRADASQRGEGDHRVETSAAFSVSRRSRSEVGHRHGRCGKRPPRFIRNLCELAARRPDAHQLTLSDQLDAWLLHPVLGLGGVSRHHVRGVLGDFLLRANPDGLDRDRPGCGGRLGGIPDARRAICARCWWMACSAESAAWWCSCHRSCCCFFSSACWKAPVTWRAPHF